MFAPLKRGRKRIFNEELVIELAEKGMTCQEIADHITCLEHNEIHYASIRHFLVSKKIPYSKGRVGRPTKENQKKRYYR